MKHEHFEEIESTSWAEEYPHNITIRVSFKSQSDRKRFLKEIRDILRKE